MPSFPVEMLNPRLLEPQSNLPDKMIWKLEPSGKFSIKSTYNFLRQKRTISLPDSKIWHDHIPKKISFFMSNLWRGKVATDDSLRKFNIYGPSICSCCLNEEETQVHAFIQGPRAKTVWSYFQASCGLMDSFSTLHPRCLLWWKRSCKNSVLQYITNIAPQIICWSIWKAINSGKYNSKQHSTFSINLTVSKLIISCVQIQFPKLQFNTSNWNVFLDTIAARRWKISAMHVL